MEPLGASTKRNVGGGSGLWCLAALLLQLPLTNIKDKVGKFIYCVH